MKRHLPFFLAIILLTATKSLLAQGLPFITLTNPVPESYEAFGAVVAAVGTDKVVIATPYHDAGALFEAGAAYLFSTTGAFMTTFTNPTPATNDYFGWSAAGVGADKVIVGAYGDDTGATDAGSAYLFNTSGALLLTFTNPAPASFDGFGSTVAAVGTDKVLIGAYADSIGATYAGAAYLFSTTGALLMTFTNPTPQLSDSFGSSVAAVDTDKVIISAQLDNTEATDAGAAYIFSIAGTLLTTITNPTPFLQDYFGSVVAAVGTDKVLIGAYLDNTGATDAGAAYLFSTTGTLLMTFTNPTPATSDYFGWAVAGVGADKVLIGARNDNTGASLTGIAYLFNTNGTLLTTITNPAPATSDYFGNAVATVGADKVLIGAYGNFTNTGAAYLFTITPSLRIFLTTSNTAIVAWPAPFTGWQLQSNTNLATTNWVSVTNAVNVVGSENQVSIALPTGNKFFRLFQP